MKIKKINNLFEGEVTINKSIRCLFVTFSWVSFFLFCLLFFMSVFTYPMQEFMLSFRMLFFSLILYLSNYKIEL